MCNLYNYLQSTEENMYNNQSSELDKIHQPGINFLCRKKKLRMSEEVTSDIQASIHHSHREKNPDLHKCGFNPIISLVEHVTVYISQFDWTIILS